MAALYGNRRSGQKIHKRRLSDQPVGIYFRNAGEIFRPICLENLAANLPTRA